MQDSPDESKKKKKKKKKQMSQSADSPLNCINLTYTGGEIDTLIERCPSPKHDPSA
jgi:hypothetical protein